MPNAVYYSFISTSKREQSKAREDCLDALGRVGTEY